MTSSADRLTGRLVELGDYVRSGRDADAVDGVVPRLVVEPPDANSLARMLAIANDETVTVVPRGGGTKLGLGSIPNRVDIVLSTSRLNRIVEHASDDLTASVEAGCTIGSLQAALASRGQRLALDPPHAERATLGGVLATNDSGPLRTRFGSARNLVLGVTVALVDGTLARSGGKVVKNVAGYDLPKLLTGSLGTLGVIVEATIRLYPTPREVYGVTFSFPSAARAAECLNRVASSQLAPSCLQLRAGASGEISVDVRIDGAQGVAIATAPRLEALAVEGRRSDGASDTWSEIERLRTDTAGALVMRVGVRPSSIAAFVGHARALADSLRCAWALVVQSDGTGFVRFDGDASGIERMVASVRDVCVYAVVVSCPIEMKRGLDIWGKGQDADALMRRVKARFDPRGTLNPGRFVAGI